MAHMVARFYRYGNRIYQVGQRFGRVGDGREDPTHSLAGLLWKTLVGIMVGIGSFNQLEEAIRRGQFDFLGSSTRPSADTFGRAFAQLDRAELVGVNDAVFKEARYNKAFEGLRVEGWRVAAIDGTGIFSTVSPRLGKNAHHRRRRVRDKDTEREEDIYLEQALAISYVGGEGPTALLALARIPKGEGETTVAMRELKRLHEVHWRYCDVVTMDSNVAKGPVLNLILEQGKDFVVRVKQENCDIIKDAAGLFDRRPPDQVYRDVKVRDEARALYDLEIWDEEGLTSWQQVKQSLRCLRIRRRRKEVNAEGQVVKAETLTTHLVTSAAQATMPALTVWKIAHVRWDVENSSFHFLKHHCNLEHAWSYDPPVIEVILTLFMLAFNLFMLFVHRNLRRFEPKRGTLLGVMRWLYEELARLTQPLWLTEAEQEAT